MQARAESRRRTAVVGRPVRFCTASAGARLLPLSWRMSDPTLDSRSRPAHGRRAIVVLLVDDQAFVGAAVGLLLESELDIELPFRLCAPAFKALASARRAASCSVRTRALDSRMN